MASIALAYDELTVAVRSEDASHLRWLAEMLGPWFAPADARDAACTVDLTIDAVEYERVRRRRRVAAVPAVAFVFDRGPLALPCWDEGGERVLLHETERIVYRVAADGRRVTILASDPALTRRIRLMRVVRELAMSQSWFAGRSVLHGAAFACDGAGVVIAGAKAAGKTTLLWHALGGAGAELIANDRVVIDTAPEPPLARGMPSVVSVRAPTLRLFPELEQAWRSRRYAARRCMEEPDPVDLPPPACHLTPAQFAALRGAPTRREAPLRLVVFLRRERGAPPITLRELPSAAAAERIAASLFAAPAPQRISDVFVPSGLAPHGACADGGPAASRLAAVVRCVDCVLGDWSRQSPPPLSEVLRPYLRER